MNDPWKATRHLYGNQDEARGTIQKLWAFIAALQVPPLSVPVAAFSLYVCFVALFRPCVRHSSSPSFALDTPSLPRLTTLPPSLFEPRRTVYKVALLNWKPQLCRCCSHPLLFHLACFFSTAAVPPLPFRFISRFKPGRWSGWIVVRVDIRAGFIGLAGSPNFFRGRSTKDPRVAESHQWKIRLFRRFDNVFSRASLRDSSPVLHPAFPRLSCGFLISPSLFSVASRCFSTSL